MNQQESRQREVKVTQKKILACPKCGFKFEVSYARAFACAGCPSAVSCSYAKCPKCSHEFPIRSSPRRLIGSS